MTPDPVSHGNCLPSTNLPVYISRSLLITGQKAFFLIFPQLEKSGERDCSLSLLSGFHPDIHLEQEMFTYEV